VVLISDAYAQTATTAATGGAESGLLGMLPIVLIFGVMYFIMIRPQMKKQKELRALLEALAKGDEVVTVGGMLGRIAKIGDNYLTLEIADKVEVQVQRSAVVQVLPKGSIKAA
jgi:preprotein translocase subunit YajC